MGASQQRARAPRAVIGRGIGHIRPGSHRCPRRALCSWSSHVGSPSFLRCMTAPRLGEVTMLLQQVAAGQHDARGRLAELVYDELRVLADRQLRGMRGQTLQPTVLVHEAWLRLLGDAVGEFNNRQHFLGVAAKAMRSVLVDHVRKRKSQKRGGDVSTGPLDESVAFLEAGEVDLLDLDEALRELEASDADLARQVEMKFFSGMTNAEIAAVEGVSESTVERGWRFARARLRSRLDGGTRA